MSRIVLNTSGSLGDLHPYLAVGVGLRARGHDVVVASHPEYRERAETAGLAFAPVGGDIADLGDLDEVMRKAMSKRTGSRFVLETLVLGTMRRSVDDLLVASEGADLLVSHVVSLAGPIVAEKLGIPRVHSMLQPMTLYSTTDPPLVPMLFFAEFWRRRGPATWRALYALMGAACRPWLACVDDERARLGMPPGRGNALLAPWSPLLNLALFSAAIAPPQPDWPANTVATGFPMWRGNGHDTLPPEVLRFLEAGEPPVVFTLGSSAVFDARGFYVESAKAAAALGLRAVLLTGIEDRNPVPAELLTDRVLRCEYAPFDELFPRAAAIVHQGGIGTTAQALVSGRPMLVMPYSHDQPDNARRCVKAGVARVIDRDHYTARSAARELTALLADNQAKRAARTMAERLARENGAETAADAIESVLSGRSPLTLRVPATAL
jgi:UDP:flavonoid glycosyltransferase YjiC (YdhE family)